MKNFIETESQIFNRTLRYQLDKINVFEIIPALVDTAMVARRGKGKIPPQALVNEFIKAFRKNKYEVNIGKIKLLRIINRISPFLADRLMKGGRQIKNPDGIFNDSPQRKTMNFKLKKAKQSITLYLASLTYPQSLQLHKRNRAFTIFSPSH